MSEAGHAQDGPFRVPLHQLGAEVHHEEHGEGGPAARLLPHQHAAKVGQLHQEIQRSSHLEADRPTADVTKLPSHQLQGSGFQEPQFPTFKVLVASNQGFA